MAHSQLGGLSATAAVYLPSGAPSDFAAALSEAVAAWNSSTHTAMTVAGAVGLIQVDFVVSGWVSQFGFPASYWGITTLGDGVKLANGSGAYALDQWHPSASADYQSFGTTVRNDSKDLVIAVASNKLASSANVDLGYFEFVASSNEVAYDPNDFTLIFADLLDAQNVPRAVSPRNIDRRTEPIQYRNELAQNYPNPFNPSTTIAFSLTRAASVDLTIYDVTGARIRELVEGRKPAGIHRVAWDGTDQRGIRVASGVYFYRLTTSSFKSTKKMVLLR